ncbi:hypothetical protein K439DRAFT_1410374, partial [Ramaria rubella]
MEGNDYTGVDYNHSVVGFGGVKPSDDLASFPEFNSDTATKPNATVISLHPQDVTASSAVKKTLDGTPTLAASNVRSSVDNMRRPGSPISGRSIFYGLPHTLPNNASRRLSTTDFSVNFSGTLEHAVPLATRKQPSRFWARDPLPGEVDVGHELGDNGAIWEKYCEEAQGHDKVMTDGWNGEMDVLLVFAALFSAILTAFIIEFYRQLQPDTQSASLVLLTNMAMVLQCIANGTTCTNLPTLPPNDFQVPEKFQWINALWFTSLTLSLSVSAMAILVKQWIHAYYSGLTGLPKTYARIRQFRYNGIKKWHMSGIINALPSVMYLAVILFFAGLLVLLSGLNIIIYYVCVAIIAVTGMAYVATTILPVIDPGCPFRTP